MTTMARMRAVGATLATMALVAACGGSTVLPAATLAQNQVPAPAQTPTQTSAPTQTTVPPPPDPCKYTPGPQGGTPVIYTKINEVSAELGLDVHYPEGFTPPSPPPPDVPTYGLDPLKDPANLPPLDPNKPIEVITDPSGTTKYVRTYQPLDIKYSDKAKTSIAGCPLTLRTYNGGLVGPTLRVKPGQTLRFTVENNLTTLPGHSTHAGKAAHDLDLTNLHTHGLEVDPVGKWVENEFIASDNVLIQYGRGKKQQYEITLHPDHPPGTFWYHAHAHGSTATQVSSGMAGTLIVEDDKGNLDKPDSDRSMLPDSLKVPEKTLVFQSTFYGQDGRIANLVLGSENPGPASWGRSNRRITINGQIVPRIEMRPGEIQRWRMVSTTFEKLLQLRLAGHSLQEIAVDGHYLPKVDEWKPNQVLEMGPGYRSDVLVQASQEPGIYMLVDGIHPTGFLAEADSLTPEPQRRSILAAVVVRGDPVEDQQLPTTEEMQEIAYGWSKDEDDNPVMNKPLSEQWIEQRDGTLSAQTVEFDLSYPDQNNFAINSRVYRPGLRTKVTAGKIDKWVVTTTTRGAHVFHIHVNPFQVGRKGPDGKPELVWKDTLIVPRNQTSDPNLPVEPMIFYTRYDERFTGAFVIHCHLLDHEDNGMMREVEVVEPPE